MIQLGQTSQPRPAIDRSGDRVVAMTAIAIAVSYLLAATVAVGLPIDAFSDTWLPLHLALAGAASTAIAGLMPFFSAAFAAAPPVDTRLRWTSISAVALGALGVTFGATVGLTALAVAGGLSFIVGVILTGAATVRPLGRGLGPRGGLVTRGYVTALVLVAVGALAATLFLAGWSPIVEAWGRLKPAHAWLNLVGFVSLVIATTLLHFFPTVVGSRIQRTRSAYLTVGALPTGAVLVSLGYALESDLLARLGAASVLLAAAALVDYAWRIWRTRATWTTDPDWHRFAMGGLVSAIAWFVVGMTLAAGRVLLEGADPASASIDILIGPLALGWVGLAIVASATHLVPAVGPGDPLAHRRQRGILGRGATIRLVAADGGILAITVGQLLGAGLLAAAGLVTAAIALAATAVLIALAVRIGLMKAGPS